jgi:tRNA(Ile)-lysidine synthase
MALLHGLATLRERHGLTLRAASVNHGLRAEAVEEVARARKLSEALEVPFEELSLDLGPGGNVQARARRARYAALYRCADEFLGEEALVATAHHADDRAETVLLRLLRGCSLEALGVLPPLEGRLLRPLIRTRKESVLAHVARHGIEFSDDPSNVAARFLRVRVRRELLPLLSNLSPQIVEHLNQLADDAARGGSALGLGKEQREQLRKALQNPALKVDLALRGGLRLFRP